MNVQTGMSNAFREHCRYACSELYKSFRTLASSIVLLAIGICAGNSALAQSIATVVIESTSSSNQTNVPVTFGHAFPQGAVPSGSTIVLTQTGGSTLPTQVDVKSRYSDGSIKHAVISTRVPSLAGNGSVPLSLSTASGSGSGTGLQVSQLLATNFDARVSLNVSGTTYSASARELLNNQTPTVWLTGPVVTEWVVRAPVKTSTGQAHPHLAAQFHVRAYGNNAADAVRVDVVIENGYTFVSSPTAFTCDIQITVGSNVVDTRSSLKHSHHTRWHRRFWWGHTGQAYARIDTRYLQDTGLVPKYASVTPTNSYLSGLRQQTDPLTCGDQTPYMPSTGEQNGIGPLPRWAAVYLVSGDRRAFNNLLANDDGAAAYSVHFRDENTGYPVSVIDHPNSSIDYPNDIPAGSGGNACTADNAHPPSQGYVSYLVTGDLFYLEELQFWASWHLIFTHAQYRNGANGWVVGRGQIREQAWILRNIAQAAAITPDNHPLKAKFTSNVNSNLARFRQLYVNNPSANKLGAIVPYEGLHEMRAWQDDFFTWVAQHLVELGFDARDIVLWKSKFPVARMGNTDYCYVRATPYTMAVGRSDGTWFSTIREVYEANWGALPASCPDGQAMVGYPDSPAGYPANLRPALAAAVTAGAPGAAEAWARFLASRPQPDFSNYPNWAIVPRTSSPAPNPPTNVRAE
jgi:hypothetical protein